MAKKKAKKKFRKKHWSDVLVRMSACRAAVRWCRRYPSLKAAWKACRQPDWMRWLATVLSWGPSDVSEKSSRYAFQRNKRFQEWLHSPGFKPWAPMKADLIRRFWPNPPAMSRLERDAKEHERGA